MIRAFIGLGANLNQPQQTIRQAANALADLPGCREFGRSKLYLSKPMGDIEQPDYVNAVIAVDTTLSAAELFVETCKLEHQYGRVRNGQHWGPRTLDLDILLYGDHVIDTAELTVPHYGLKEREFVIYPILDITPHLTLPCGTNLMSLTEQVPFNDMVTLEWNR